MNWSEGTNIISMVVDRSLDLQCLLHLFGPLESDSLSSYGEGRWGGCQRFGDRTSWHFYDKEAYF